MSGNAEDLYLKGFMAFNGKDYKSAKVFWEQALASDPNHAKAKAGLAKLKGASKKRSSKEVFQEIKKLYAAKKFPEALKLCELLLKKHPSNTDLQGLRTKLTNRIAGEKTVATKAPVMDKRSTMIIAEDAEQAVGSDTANLDVASEVEKIIQEGVNLYEIQDYELAIETWQKALALDPNNRIARDYIDNVSTQLGGQAEPEPEPEPKPQPVAVTPAPSKKPDKDKLLEIYNGAMELYKKRKYTQALEKWNYILEFYPTHQETLQCVQKTNALIEKELKFVDMLQRARQDIANGDSLEAERVLTQLAIEAPHLAGLDEAQADLDAARAKASAASSAAISLVPDSEDDAGDEGSEFAATDDEITQYFAPDADSTAQARKVSKVVAPKKTKKAPVNVFKVIAVVIFLAAVGIGGFYGYEIYKKQLRTSTNQEPLLEPLVREVDWNSAQAEADDFYNLGSDFADNGDFLLASFAFKRVEDIASPRLSELEQATHDQIDLEVKLEVTGLTEVIQKAKSSVKGLEGKIINGEYDDKDLERANAEIARENYLDASERLFKVLSADPEHDRAREMLGEVLERLAFKELGENRLPEASNYFKQAAVLQPGYDMSRRHSEVIQRFFNGMISDEEKDQWFYFFK